MAVYKRAVVEVQFNWIFILIAGALILFLFASIILKQKTTADSAAETILLKDIASITVGSEATTGVTSELELSKATLSFGCNTIRVGQKSQPLQQMVLFSPTTVNTPLIIHTTEWSLPFRATNVVYLSSPQIRYVLIGNNDLAKQINKSMPEKFTVDFYQDYAAFSAKPIQEDDHIRIIFFDQTEFTNNKNSIFNKLSSKSTKETSILVIDGDQTIGTASFYAKTQTDIQLQRSMEYLKEEMLMGAIFTDSYEQYQCVANNLLAKLSRVADIHDKRRQALFGETSPATHPLNSRCNLLYTGQTSTDLQRLKTSTDYNELFDAAYNPTTGLTTINKNLEKNSCPLLY
jgi:hypothetical protein